MTPHPITPYLRRVMDAAEPFCDFGEHPPTVTVRRWAADRSDGNVSGNGIWVSRIDHSHLPRLVMGHCWYHSTLCEKLRSPLIGQALSWCFWYLFHANEDSTPSREWERFFTAVYSEKEPPPTWTEGQRFGAALCGGTDLVTLKDLKDLWDTLEEGAQNIVFDKLLATSASQ